jgi:hypothetical protein
MKRSGRDEPMWVVTHMCMVTTLGISLYSYLHLKLTKTTCFSYYLLCSLFDKIGEQEGWKILPGSRGGRGGEEVAQIMYTPVSQCENNKIKFKKVPCSKHAY